MRPQSIPDWLGLVGDAADGFPGIPGWGEKSAAAVLAKYEHLEAIPADPHTWGLSAIAASRAARLAESLTQHRAEALLFRNLATLREDVGQPMSWFWWVDTATNYAMIDEHLSPSVR